MILPICVISLYCNIKHLFETWKYLYKSGSSDDKCIDSQHFGTCDSHTDFKVRNVKSQSHGAGAYCGGHLAAQLVDEKLSGDNRCRPIQYSCIYLYVASWMQLRVESDVGLALLRSARETRIFCCGVCCLHDIAVIFRGTCEVYMNGLDVIHQAATADCLMCMAMSSGWKTDRSTDRSLYPQLVTCLILLELKIDIRGTCFRFSVAGK